MNPLISVIVPIYNVEKYLRRCVESIINQTYKNLEIILVDDGSPDNSGKICDEYAEKDERVKVIHKENGGLSDARNAGMKIATGEYVSFIDSDDWIEAQMLELLLANIIDADCDIASCGVRMVWDDGTPSKMLTNLNGNCVFDDTEKILDALISTAHFTQLVWNKLYRRKIIENILFPVGKVNEDEFWTWQALAASKRAISIDTPLYNYLQRPNSIMRNMGKYDLYAVIEAKCNRLEYIEKNFPNLKEKNRVDLLYACLYQAQRAKILLDKEKYKICYEKIKRTVKEHPISKQYLKDFSLRKRLRIKSIYYFFGAVCAVQNLLGIGNKSNI